MLHRAGDNQSGCEPTAQSTVFTVSAYRMAFSFGFSDLVIIVMCAGAQVVRDPAATALAAELLLQGPGVWPFDSAKQALLVSAIASVLPGIGPGAVSITGSGAPFRRRLLQVFIPLCCGANFVSWYVAHSLISKTRHSDSGSKTARQNKNTASAEVGDASMLWTSLDAQREQTAASRFSTASEVQGV